MKTGEVTQLENKKPTLRQMVSILHGEKLVEILEQAHPYDAHILIKDNVSPDQLKEIKKDGALWNRFSAVKNKAKQLMEYDNKPATLGDVNKASTNVYRILLNMISVLNKTNEQLISTVNEMRVAQGLEPVNFDQESTQGAETGKDTNEPTS